MDAIQLLHEEIHACHLCVDGGYLPAASPVVSGRITDRMMLIGQAPGITEVEARRPFHGRAGRELFRWLASVHISEGEFRENVYMTSITKCYPGRARSGSGDRRPSAAEIGLCRPYLERQLQLVKPQSVLLVGTLAIERFLPKAALTAVIGHRFEREGMILVPLPHPSGASRWLNQAENKARLQQALEHVSHEWQRMVAPARPL